MNSPALSVVVIGRNEGARLEGCLQSIAAMRGVSGEKQIIYVDSASTDNSVDIATALGAEILVLGVGNLTAARARNAGWRRARAPFVLFLDGDTILHPDFPRLALAALAGDERIAIAWGHRREIHPEKSLYNRVLDLDWIYEPGDTEFCGGDMLMRACALKHVDGFDSTLIAGEEPEMCRRLRHAGYRILHIDSPMTGHDLNISRFGQYWKRALRAGHAYAEISSRYRASSDPMWLSNSRGNFVRGGFWIASLIACIASLSMSRLSVLLGLLPLTLWMSLLLALSCRSGWKARWKAPSKYALLALYGIHSHLQHIPILIGQLECTWSRIAGRQRRLIEYKDSAGLE